MRNGVHPFALAAVILSISVLVPPEPAEAQWPQWGGPEHNFSAPAAALAESWPEKGPKELWRRPLGDGNSAIAIDGGTLYTMARIDDKEVTIALDAATGKTHWQTVEENAKPWEEFITDFGLGPHGSPLVAGDRVFVTGIRAQVSALDAATGKKIWSRDLWKDFDAKPIEFGYSASPLAYGKTVIVPVGKPGPALLALDQATGKTVWKSKPLAHTYSSPTLLRIGGQDQIVLFLASEVAGFDPKDGSLLWSHEHKTQYNVNAMTPIIGASTEKGGILFLSSAYDGGSRALRLERRDGKTHVEELWFSGKMKVHHGSAVFLDGTFYASSGDFGPAFLVATAAESGKIRSQERGFAKANLVAVGKQLLILDEDGNLAVARPTDDGFGVLTRAQVLNTRAWTSPTVVGTVAYLRDRKEIVALDLGAKANAAGTEKAKAETTSAALSSDSPSSTAPSTAAAPESGNPAG